MRGWISGPRAAFVVLAVVAGCGAGPDETTRDRADLATSHAASARLGELRARFRLTPVARSKAPERAAIAVIGAGIATAFESTPAGGVRAVLPHSATHGAMRPASVELPARANGSVQLGDDTSHLRIAFALRGAEDAPIAVADGLALYESALAGSDVIHRVRAEGTEDYVVFEARPAREELTYDVDVSGVAGLRLVSNTLEFLDPGGAPRLRIAPPYVVDSGGTRHVAHIGVDGCVFDTNRAPPWGRAVKDPGAQHCVVRIEWSEVAYPLIVDPSWVATGDMANARENHAATLLPTGKVLVTGGYDVNGDNLGLAELYDEATGVFASTDSSVPRAEHTATLLRTGKVLLVGGPVGCCGSLSSAELYDPIAGTFAATGSLKAARERQTATEFGSGLVLIAGGSSGCCNAIASAELYDETAGTFALTGSMIGLRQSHTATLLGTGKILVAGGAGFSILSSAEVYDPTLGTFGPTSSMTAAHAYHTATLLGSGKVLIAGGGGPPNAELYDPTAYGTFSAASPMSTAHSFFAASMLASGKVLIAGGAGSPGSAELYDPVAGTFAIPAELATPRYRNTETLLASGKVLVTGGGDLDSNLLSSAEVYDVVAAGAACVINDDCVSGICDQYCCSALCGTCMACTAGAGACVSVTNKDDPDTCTGASTCDALGACKRKNGQTSASPAACASGFQSDGVCCDTACSGPCDACDQGGMIGTCSPLPLGDLGSPACGAAVCDGVKAACPTMCASDMACAPSDYCGAGGTCRPRKSQGAVCDATADCLIAGCRDCTTGHCVDGVCCDSACDTTCVACAAALQEPLADGGVPQDGVCGPALQYTNPHHDVCPTNAGDPCGPDGQCSGSGSCNQTAKAGTSCGPSTCSATIVTGQVCDGSGTCNPNASLDCDPFLCNGGSCTSTCAGNADCAADSYCSKAGVCAKKQASGASCTAADQCVIGHCVDGYCCDGPCTNQCEACNVSGAEGTCAPVSGPPHGARSACDEGTTSAPCSAATCDGKERMSCAGHVGSKIGCRSASCTEGTATLAGNCNGMGACEAAQTKNCEPFVCAGTACASSCTGDADCGKGNHCEAESKKCIPGATCDDNHTLTQADGTKKDCTPYRCTQEGTCAEACNSGVDCTEGSQCTADGQCVLATSPPPESGQSSGCGMPGSNPKRYGVPLMVALLALLALRSRRVGAVRCE